MSENGVLTIPCTGHRTFEFPCAPGLKVTLDVVAVASQYWDMRRGFEDADGTVPPSQYTGLRKATLEFVRGLIAGAATEAGVANPELNDSAQALAFVKLLIEEESKLRDFFVPSTPGSASSPESTKLTFSD